MTGLSAPRVEPGEGALLLEIEDLDVSRADIRAEALDRFVEYCAEQGHVPVGRPSFTFTPGEISTVEIRSSVRPATSTWVETVLARRD